MFFFTPNNFRLKIIIINYRYFFSGGPERYLFNITELLQNNGHTVIPFSVKHAKNEFTEYEKYFLEPIGNGNEVYANEYDKTSFDTVKKTMSRMLYSFEAKNKLEILIQKVQPDLIYVLHYQNKISASIFDAAEKYNIPVVNRISDFGQMCANALLFRPKEKDICERCLHGSKLNAVVNKCVQQSYIYSAIKVTSLVISEQLIKTKSKIKAFVVPSTFTLKKMVEYGYDAKNLHHIPSFFSNKNIDATGNIYYKNFALFIGRIEVEKGLFTLINAFINTSFNLKIIGFSNDGYQAELENYLIGKNHNIEFLGKKTFSEIIPFLKDCAFTIVPSECYDNFPNSLIESYAYKKAVIASNLGSLKEMVDEAETGLLFIPKDANDLRKKVTFLFNNPDLNVSYGNNGYNKLLSVYSAPIHYEKLMKVFYAVINSGSKKNVHS